MTLFELWFSQGICPVVRLLGQDRNKDADVENGLQDSGRGRVSWDEVREWHGLIYTTKRKIDS